MDWLGFVFRIILDSASGDNVAIIVTYTTSVARNFCLRSYTMQCAVARRTNTNNQHSTFPAASIHIDSVSLCSIGWLTCVYMHAVNCAAQCCWSFSRRMSGSCWLNLSAAVGQVDVTFKKRRLVNTGQVPSYSFFVSIGLYFE